MVLIPWVNVTEASVSPEGILGCDEHLRLLSLSKRPRTLWGGPSRQPRPQDKKVQVPEEGGFCLLMDFRLKAASGRWMANR